MLNIEFLFNLDQRVVTALGAEGIVTMCAYDHAGNQYYVQTATNGAWFRESQLSNKE